MKHPKLQERSQLTGHTVGVAHLFPLQALHPEVLKRLANDYPSADLSHGWLEVRLLLPYLHKYAKTTQAAVAADLQPAEPVVASLYNPQMETALSLTEPQSSTFADRLSDKLATVAGSWRFIIGFGLVLAVWIGVNIVLATSAFDPFPFILLNLVLSCLAAIQAPVIMMSQNRKEIHDRDRAIHDYAINLQAEAEIRALHAKIDELKSHLEISRLREKIDELLLQNASRNGPAGA